MPYEIKNGKDRACNILRRLRTIKNRIIPQEHSNSSRSDQLDLHVVFLHDHLVCPQFQKVSYTTHKMYGLHDFCSFVLLDSEFRLLHVK